jgi:Tfp pilus assembly protein FimT
LLNPVPVRQNLRSTAGFSLTDILIAMSVLAILMAMAVPTIQDIGNAIALGEMQRNVQSELQQARLKSVSSNRIMRVRFNCPLVGQFRTVELIGTPTAPAAQDTANNRCNDAAYPFPAPDANPVTLPNQDGPVRRLHPKVSFGATQTIEFRPTGMAYSVNADATSGPPIAGQGVSITVTKGAAVKAVTVNALGRVQ